MDTLVVDRLFIPLTFQRGPAMRNRFMLAPLTNTQSADDGTVSADEIDWLDYRARGGFGQVVTCASAVLRQGRGFRGEIGVYDDAHGPGLRRLATRIASSGSLVSVQLNHAGLRAIADDPLSSSADAATGARAMSAEDVEEVVQGFVSAALRAQAAGFHGAQIHGAHGYLLSQFLSKELNRRTDEYGGSLENRSRLLFRIVREVRAQVGGDFQLGVRLSPERYGQDFFEVREVAQRLLDEADIDYLDMSLWNVFKEPDDVRARGQSIMSHFTALERGDVRLGVAGRIVDPRTALVCLDEGADYVALGKAAIINGDFPNRLRSDSAYVPRWLPVSREYLRGQAVGDRFIKYLSGWPNFIKGADLARTTPFASAWTAEQLGLVPSENNQDI